MKIHVPNAQFTADANQVIKKPMPHIPVTDTSCINGRLPYWVYASENQLPVKSQEERRNSIVIHATGNTKVEKKSFYF